MKTNFKLLFLFAVIAWIVGTCNEAGAQPAPEKPKPTECKCTYPLKLNKSYCNGVNGGKYCINRKGKKHYPPKPQTK